MKKPDVFNPVGEASKPAPSYVWLLVAILLGFAAVCGILVMALT
ncbi:MAG: hypothetical protein AAFW47_07825 [Pseudomonadota bacterium]